MIITSKILWLFVSLRKGTYGSKQNHTNNQIYIKFLHLRTARTSHLVQDFHAPQHLYMLAYIQSSVHPLGRHILFCFKVLRQNKNEQNKNFGEESKLLFSCKIKSNKVYTYLRLGEAVEAPILPTNILLAALLAASELELAENVGKTGLSGIGFVC